MTTESSFVGSPIKQGILFDLSNNVFPSLVHGFAAGKADPVYAVASTNSTTFGYVFGGTALIKYQGMDFPLKQGMYFTVPGPFQISGGEGILIECLHYKGFFTAGGPVEASGRLKYIDGCTDSLLAYPIKKGDPCLNVLYFPKNVFQTQHTHPSYRVGLVVDGSGTCVTPQGDVGLEKGLAFVIHPEKLHSFKTTSAANLVVVSFHPDSDFGPEDENHPMLNRTVVEGVGANHLPGLFTR